MSELPGRSVHKSRGGLARIWNALRYSLAGLADAYRHESAFRQELLLAAIALPLAAVLPASLTQKAMLIGAVLLVLIVELLNAAVETAVDRISLENHDLSKRAKDIGSAAVFLCLLNGGLIWLLVLLDVFTGQ